MDTHSLIDFSWHWLRLLCACWIAVRRCWLAYRDISTWTQAYLRGMFLGLPLHIHYGGRRIVGPYADLPPPHQILRLCILCPTPLSSGCLSCCWRCDIIVPRGVHSRATYLLQTHWHVPSATYPHAGFTLRETLRVLFVDVLGQQICSVFGLLLIQSTRRNFAFLRDYFCRSIIDRPWHNGYADTR